MNKYVPNFNKGKSLMLKAILPFIVILGHLSYRVDITWLKPVCHVGAIAVSIFFFISGYGLAVSFRKNQGTNINNFVVTRFPKIIIPYLITVVLYFLAVRLPSHQVETTVWKALSTGTSYQSHLWYVYAYLALNIGFYIAFKYISEKYRLLGLTIYTMALIVVLKGIGYDRCWYVSLLSFPIGSIYARYEEKINTTLLSKKWSVFLFFLLLASITFISWRSGSDWLLTISFACIAMMAISVCSILPIESFASGTMKWLAGLSYELYLCQVMVMDFLRSDWCMIESDGMYIILSIIIVIPVSMIVHIISNPKTLFLHA